MYKVDVIFSTPKKFALASAWLKSPLGMGTPYSHTCLLIKSNAYDRDIIYEANGHGIRAEKFENWKKRNKIVHKYSIDITKERKLNIIKYCIDHLGIEYGFFTLAYLFLKDKFNIVIKKGKDGTNKLICSEFAYLMIKDEMDSIYDILDRPKPEHLEDMHPKEFWNTLMEYHQYRIHEEEDRG